MIIDSGVRPGEGYPLRQVERSLVRQESSVLSFLNLMILPARYKMLNNVENGVLKIAY